MTGFPRSRMRAADLVGEALAGVLQRPARSALTALGTVLGVGTFVAILGLTTTASAQIDERFNAMVATEITVVDTAAQQAPYADPGIPDDGEQRVRGLNGVTGAAVHWDLDLRGDAGVARTPAGARRDVTVTAVSVGMLPAAGVTLAQGTGFDPWHRTASARVAVLGSASAARLGIHTVHTQPAVFIAGQPFSVIGIFDDTERRPELLLSVLIPDTTAREIWGAPQDRVGMFVTTDIGAAQQVAREIPFALRPDHPEYVAVAPPPNPQNLKGGVSDDMRQLFLLLAGICLVIGTVGIANTTLVAVLERTGEIGLRRALGARGRHVTTQILAESALLGALGGTIGASAGVLTVVVVSLGRQWTPVADPRLLLVAPVLGLAAGLVAGVYPAWRAARVAPAEALRG